jgi:hypothetical protein
LGIGSRVSADLFILAPEIDRQTEFTVNEEPSVTPIDKQDEELFFLGLLGERGCRPNYK